MIPDLPLTYAKYGELYCACAESVGGSSACLYNADMWMAALEVTLAKNEPWCYMSVP